MDGKVAPSSLSVGRWQSGEDEINGEREGEMLSGGDGGGGHGQE